MEPKIQNPATTFPNVLRALLDLHPSVAEAGIPSTTRCLKRGLRQSDQRLQRVPGHAPQGTLARRRPDERTFTIATWRETPYFTDAERAALALAEAATRLADHPDAVPNQVWAEAARHYPRLASLHRRRDAP